MQRTYILETDRANRQQTAQQRTRKYIQTVTYNAPVEQDGTVNIRPETIRIMHGKAEPKNIGNVARTNRIIRNIDRNARVLDEFSRVLGMAKIEHLNEAKKMRRMAFKARRQGK